MSTGLAASEFAIALTIGATAYIGIFHLSFWRGGRGDPVHAWVALWCATCVAFQSARFVQLHSLDPATAMLATRAQVALAMLLITSLIGFARTLADGQVGPRLKRWMAAACAIHVSLALGTSFYVTGRVDTISDWFGRSHLASPTSPMILLLLPMIVASITFVVQQIVRAPNLARNERSVLVGAFVLYALLGLASVLSSMRLLPVPMAISFGPFIVALGLDYHMTHKHRALHHRLEALVEGQTTELRRSEERYRRLVNEAPLGILACTRDGSIVAVNPHLLEIIGSPSAEATMSSINILEAPGMIDAGVAGAFREVMETGRSISREFTYRSRWGRRSITRAHIAAMRDEDGSVSGAQAIIEDISERRRLEGRLRQSRKMEAVGQLAAGIAHEINNPMAYVRSNLMMLRQDWGELLRSIEKGKSQEALSRVEEFRDLVDDALEGVERTVSIVRDVKAFAHAGGGERVPADLNAVIEDALRFASTELGDRLTIERLYGDLPPLLCAPSQLQQVFVNLIVNAAHAIGERGHIRIVTRAQESTLIARIEDDGCGIEPEDRERIFEPFFTTKEAGGGTGLGLYISYELVSLHGGELRVRSEVGVGSSFELQLPLA